MVCRSISLACIGHSSRGSIPRAESLITEVDKQGAARYAGCSLYFRTRYQACGVQGLGRMPPLAVPKNQGRFGVPYSTSRPKSLMVAPLISLPKVKLQFAPLPDWA